MRTVMFLSLLLISTLVRGMDNVPPPSVIPSPQQMVETGRPFKITSGTKIILGGVSARFEFIAGLINDALCEAKRPALKVVHEESLHKAPLNYIYFGSVSSDSAAGFLAARNGLLTHAMESEGYFLDIRPEGVVVIAASEKGVFYGAMTLLQLLRHEKRSVTVTGVSIHDFPSLRVRGITDDISRGQVSTLENFRKIIRFCARYKLNVYSPYIEDMVLFKRHPLIGKNRGALSTAEWKELDAYAHLYFVELIPTFETLGHWENILSIPDYSRYAEFPGAHTVNISDERLYTLLDEMIGEIAGSFSSPYFNMAADESWDVGLGANRERVASSGIATVHAEHYTRVVNILKKYNKRPMMYGDVILNHRPLLEKIPKDITIVDWHYSASWHYDSPAIFKRAGFRFIVSPAVWNFTSPFPAYLTSFVNIRNLIWDGMENGAVGALTSTWGDYGGEALRELNYYGYAWTAECAWNPAQASADKFNRGFFPSYFGTRGNEMQTVFTLLSTPANSYLFHELWRHPMLPLRESAPRDATIPLPLRIESITTTMSEVLDLLNGAKHSVTRNADDLQYFEFVARLNLWFAHKIIAQEKIKVLHATAAVSTDTAAIGRDIETLAGGVIGELRTLREEFTRLWLRTNRFPGLELLQKRYDRQISYWQEQLDDSQLGRVGTDMQLGRVGADTQLGRVGADVRFGRGNVDTQLQSRFIYHPSAHPFAKDEPQVPHAYFRKSMTVPHGLRSAHLQLIGDTYATVAVNGRAVGMVSARRSLSLTVEHERVKLIDILPFLNDSTNVIGVDVKNFSPSGSAGVNIFCEFQTKDGATLTLVTDSTWMVSPTAGEGWMTASVTDSSWVQAEPKLYPWTIVRPDIATGRASWIER